MSDSAPLVGWELLFRSVQPAIKTNEDTLVCFVHLVLISSGFQCIGLGDSKTLEGSEPRSEALPDGWSAALKLRYLHQGKLYLFQATRLGDGVMINLIRPDERQVSMLQLNTKEVVKPSGPLSEMIPKHLELSKTVRSQLIDKATTNPKLKDGTSQTPQQPQTSQSAHSFPPAPLPNVPLIHPFGVGYNDLDPLGNIGGPRFGIGPLGPLAPINPLGPGGGGMLFQPPSRIDPSRTGLPGGSLPPGARFDPFRPPEVDRFNPRRPTRNNPDNDELPPPGFDDMYM